MDRQKVFLAATTFLILLFLLLVHAQPPPIGFLNIDCGKPENDTHTENGLKYTSDFEYIDMGEIYSVSRAYAPLNSPSSAQDLRSFPSGSRNCYNLKPVKQGGKYLVRCSFLYGNYDGLNKPPQFQIHIGVNYCDTLVERSSYFYREYVVVATSDSLSLCLIDNGKGTPYISAIEVRPLPDDFYSAMLSPSQAFRLLSRLDLGGNTTYRYPYDAHDRIWDVYPPDPEWTTVSVSSSVSSPTGFQPPSIVMSTTYTPTSGTGPSLLLNLGSTTAAFALFIAMHFAELQQLNRNETRVLDVYLNDRILVPSVRPVYLNTTTATANISNPIIYKAINLLIAQNDNSTLPPIINAMELFRILKFRTLETDGTDVAAMLAIKRSFEIIRNWNGDPCAPMDYIWDGLNCLYSNSTTETIRPRVISLNLSSSGLRGEIPESIGDLSQLQSLDFSMNDLNGGIPNFLGRLKQLTYVDLSGNNITGPIPESLQARIRSGTLILRMGSTKEQNARKKSRSSTVVVAVVCAMVFVVVVSLCMWYLWTRKKYSCLGQNKKSKSPIHSETRIFTYAELVEITRNFDNVIGEGGFGRVYHGVLKDGIEVAVKLLSNVSSSSSVQFQNEAFLLSKIHHRNLVSLIGYCNDPDHLALVYEYMHEGSLHDLLSGKGNKFLGWTKRLEIAVGAAQGLDYLHGGCKPPIIHRDVKTNNILLNKIMEAKIADFGLSKIFENDSHSYVTTMVMGTPGYLDPDYQRTHMLREKSDVYSFGIVLLQLATGLPATIKEDIYVHIVVRVLEWYEKGAIAEIIDKRLNGNYGINSAWKMTEVALACASPTAAERPDMSEVLMQLKDCLDMERAHENASTGDVAPIELAPNHAVETMSTLEPR